MVSSDDLKKYSLKQFVHNDSGQFLVGEFEDNLYLLVAGTVYSVRYTYSVTLSVRGDRGRRVAGGGGGGGGGYKTLLFQYVYLWSPEISIVTVKGSRINMRL